MLIKDSRTVVIGGISGDTTGRALGPFRLRTIAESVGYSMSLMDFPCSLSREEMLEMLDYVVGPSTLMVGISYTWEQATHYLKSSWLSREFLSVLKTRYPGVTLVIGASNFGRVPDELATECDWVVGGFAEDSLPELLKTLSGEASTLKFFTRSVLGHDVKFVDGNTDYVVENMDRLQTVFKPGDLFQPHQPMTIETCRGCVFSCAYCSYPFLGKKNYEYIRSVENLSQELRRNYDLFGTTRYMIADDTFNDSLEKIDSMQRAVDCSGIPNFEFISYIRPELLALRPAMIPALIRLGIKGAHFGLESFSTAARKSVGRVMPIDRVLDSIRDLKSLGNVKTFASFIIGLPTDTIDDIHGWKEKLASIHMEVLDSWGMGPLAIIKKNVYEVVNFVGSRKEAKDNRSIIEKNPEKYGYTIEGQEGPYALWSSKYMTSVEALSMAVDIFHWSKQYNRAGGWTLASAWHNGLTEQQINSLTLKETYVLLSQTTSVPRSRALTLLEKIRGEKAGLE